MSMIYTNDVVLFYGRTDEFSNHYPRPFKIKHMRFSCVEQHLMYCKARLFNDYEIAREIMDATDPAAIMRLGRDVKDFCDGVWSEKRVVYATAGNFAKYQQNADLFDILMATGDRVIGEASRNTSWGIGLSKTAVEATDPKYWKGLNLAGMVLMSVRETLKIATSTP